MFLRGIEYSKIVTRNWSIACSGAVMYRMHSLLEELGWSRVLSEDRQIWLLLTINRLPQSAFINLFP